MMSFSALRDSCYFFSRHLLAIALLCLPLLVPEALLQRFIEAHTGNDSSLYPLLANVLFYPLYTAALILFLDARSRGERPTTLALWGDALTLWPRFAVLFSLSVALLLAGFSLYVLPGLWLMVKLAYAECLLTLRQRSPLQAMTDSFQLTRGQFGVLALSLLAAMLPAWLFDGLSAYGLGPQPPLALDLACRTVSSFLQLFPTVVTYRLFMLRLPPPTQA